MPYVIACLIEKGGAAKTTTVVHLAHALGLMGRRVLVLDLDPQHHATKWIMNGATAERSIMEVLIRPGEGFHNAIASSRLKNVDLVHGARGHGGADAFLGGALTGERRNSLTVLRMALKTVPKEYDYVLIDCPPSVGSLNANAMTAADRLIIPIDPSEMSYEGFSNIPLTLRQLLDNESLKTMPTLSVLYTIANQRLKITGRIRHRIENAPSKPYHVFRDAIPTRTTMREIFDGQRLAHDNRTTKDVAAAYDSAARELDDLVRATS